VGALAKDGGKKFGEENFNGEKKLSWKFQGSISV